MIAEGHPVIVKGRLFRVLCADASGTVTLAPADCKLPPFGSWCSLGTGHEGPCPTRQVPLDTVPATGRITESETVTQAIKVFHTAYMLARARSPRRAGATAAAIAAVVMNVERQLSPQAARTGPKWDAIDAQIKAIAPDDFYVVRASEWDSLQAARVEGVRFIAWMIDNCEGCRVTEEDLQAWLADFLRSEAALPAQPAPDKSVLFHLHGRPVRRGDALGHPDVRATGGRVTAEFRARGGVVTVRSANGAVPSVQVSDLYWPDAKPAPERQGEAPEDRFEQFVAAAIARSPAPLRELGEYLTRVLDEDQFPTADRLLLQLATSHPAAPVGVPDVKAMVDRFLGWRLPESFAPDCYISFNPEPLKQWPGMWPVGTNLLDADQAEQMVRYMLAAAPSAPRGTPQGEGE